MMIELILLLVVPTCWSAPQFPRDACQVSGCRVSDLSLNAALSTFLCYTPEEYGAMEEMEKKIKLAEKIVPQLLTEDGSEVHVENFIEMDSDRLVGLVNLLLHTENIVAEAAGRKTEAQYLSQVIDELVQKTNFSSYLFEQASPHLLALLNCEMQNNTGSEREGRGAFLNTILESLFLTGITSTSTIAPVITVTSMPAPTSTPASKSTTAPPISPCDGRPCGEGCESGICDGNGKCVSPLENPCVQHGCEGKLCGDECLMGDIMGFCNVNSNCGFDKNQALNYCGNTASTAAPTSPTKAPPSTATPMSSTTVHGQVCPEDAPVFNSPCNQQGLACEFGKEECCGEIHSERSMTCEGGFWRGFFTDACMVGCPTTATLPTTTQSILPPSTDLCLDKECGAVCDTSDGMLQVMRYCQPDGSCGSNSQPNCQGDFCGDEKCNLKCQVGEICLEDDNIQCIQAPCCPRFTCTASSTAAPPSKVTPTTVASTAAPRPVDIDIPWSFGMAPKEIDCIATGTKVKFIWSSGSGLPGHNVVELDNQIDYDNCQNFPSGSSSSITSPFIFTADTPGTFYFACGIGAGFHCNTGNMKAELTVANQC